MRRWVIAVGNVVLVSSAALAAAAAPSASITEVRGPMKCSRGPDGQFFRARLALPASAPAGSVYTVRIESFPSAPVSSTGLNYLHDMLTDYHLPAGARYVEGSAHIVDGTGTANVRAGARAWEENGFLRVHLPGHVDNGSAYTPPSVEFQVQAVAPAGASIALQFVRHRLVANVFLLGNLEIMCAPPSGALTIGTTVVTPAAP